MPQAFPAHRYGAQLVATALLQLPSPSQSCPVTAPLVHVVDPHDVLDAYSAHAPPPLHVPVVPHVDDACCAHSASGSSPAPTFPQTPLPPLPFFAALHAWHAPVHGESQQYPSTHRPFAHWPSAAHALSPSRSFAAHVAPAQ